MTSSRDALLAHRRTRWSVCCATVVIAVLIAAISVVLSGRPSSAVAASADPNLLSNGSFEGAGVSPGPTSGWQTINAHSAAYTGGGVDGTYFADVFPTVRNGSIYQDVPVSARAGQYFQASIWIKSGTATSVPVTFALYGNLNATGHAFKSAASTTTWQQITLQLPITATTSAIRFQVIGGLVSTHLFIDNAVLTYQLLTNGGFESATRNGGGTPTWKVTSGHAGSFTGGAQNGTYWNDFVSSPTGGSMYQDVPVTAGIGQIYQASFWYRSVPSAGVVTTFALFGNLGGTGAASAHVALTTTWQQVIISMPLKAKTTGIRVQIYGGVNSQVYLDNIVLSPVSPPAQTSPAPISTSRYVRDLTGSTGDATVMRARGATDASNNPSNHSYLQLIDIGGQDQARGGVLLSATSKFITYAQTVTAMQAYIAGYASRQLPGAPVLIAFGTNNDVSVSAATGADWANKVVDPLVAYAKQFLGMTIAGADDTEPGFSASAAASRAWLSGYLGATSAKFVFNGSADGCSWTAVNGTCNNGWRASDMYWLNSGAAPTRIISLPQIYNTTMPKQWGFISLTGASTTGVRVNFGGPLTEYTACVQARSCSSLGGNQAWNGLWTAINGNPRTSQGSLPYSTDLRIN